MKEEKSTLLQIEKDELRKVIAEVKAIVSAIIHLPAEKKVSFGGLSLSNAR